MWFLTWHYLWIAPLGVLTFGCWYIRNQFSFWAKMGVPYREPHWLFGSFADFVKAKVSLAELTLDIYNEFKEMKFCGVWMLNVPCLFVTEPKLIQDIMVKEFGTWPSRGVVVNLKVDPLSGHLINLDGTKWKSVRAKLTPAFTSGKLKTMHNLLLECGTQFAEYLDRLVTNGEPDVEVRELSAKFTTDVIGSCVFGIQMNSLSDEETLFREIGKNIFEPTIRGRFVRIIQITYPSLIKYLRLSVHTRKVTDFFLRITKETFEHRERNKLWRNDFMDLLRGLKNTGETLGEDEVEFNNEVLAAQAFVFFAAGSETSSATISFCLHELAVNQAIQERLRGEVRVMMSSNKEGVTWKTVKRMKYLDMVVQETLRKYPPIPLVVRSSVKPYRIPGTDIVLPAKSQCMIPIYAVHHDPQYYPDPETFDPERFTEEAKNKRSANTFIPFGNGPRACIGIRFAEQELKIALVELMDKFKFSLCHKSQNPLQFEPKFRFLFPKGGIWLSITKNSCQ